MSICFWEPSDQKPEPAKEMLKKEINPELTWELIEQALNEKRLEILEDYNYLGWLQEEMEKIRHKYETPEKKEELAG